MLDAKIASALKEIIQNSHFKKKVSLEEQNALKEDWFLDGRQIPSLSTTTFEWQTIIIHDKIPSDVFRNLFYPTQTFFWARQVCEWLQASCRLFLPHNTDLAHESKAVARVAGALARRTSVERNPQTGGKAHHAPYASTSSKGTTVVVGQPVRPWRRHCFAGEKTTSSILSLGLVGHFSRCCRAFFSTATSSRWVSLFLRKTNQDCIRLEQESRQVYFSVMRCTREENLERRHSDRRDWRIGADGRIWNLREKTQCKGSVDAHQWCSSGWDQVLRTSIRDRPDRREERDSLQGDSDGSSSTPLRDTSWYDGEARNHFWSISSDFIYRHHVEPRVKLYVPNEESFPTPLKYIDVTRTTDTSLDVLLEKHPEDYWNVDEDRELSQDSLY